MFVEAYGRTPIACLTMLRVEQIADLLRTTDLPIAVIAHQVGWVDADFATVADMSPERGRERSTSQGLSSATGLRAHSKF